MSEGLFFLQIIDTSGELGLSAQMFGPNLTELSRLRVQAPSGLIEIALAPDRITAEGTGIPTTEVELVGQPSISQVRQGIRGRVGNIPLLIRRPRFGLRRQHRRIHIDWLGHSLYTDYRNNRRFEIRRVLDGSVVYRQQAESPSQAGTFHGRFHFLDRSADPSEASVALVVALSGIVQTSSLTNFVSPP